MSGYKSILWKGERQSCQPCLGCSSCQVTEQDSQSQAVADSQPGISQTGVVDQVFVNSQAVESEFEFKVTGPTMQPREHASSVVGDLTSRSLLTCLSMLERLQLSLQLDEVQVKVAVSRMFK